MKPLANMLNLCLVVLQLVKVSSVLC